MRPWRWGEPTAPLVEQLARGGLLAIPTESSYGLAVDPRSAAGVEAIYALKQRERGKALLVVAAEVAQLAALGIDVRSPAIAAAARHWPAPLTVVVPLAPEVSSTAVAAAAGGATLAVRIPAHARLRALLAELGPVTATSANRSGAPPIVAPRELDPLLGASDAVVVDDGVLPGGAPSTLAEWTQSGWQILRSGAYPLERLGRNGAGVASG